jgi:hypothetical protein
MEHTASNWIYGEWKKYSVSIRACRAVFLGEWWWFVQICQNEGYYPQKEYVTFDEFKRDWEYVTQKELTDKEIETLKEI